MAACNAPNYRSENNNLISVLRSHPPDALHAANNRLGVLASSAKKKQMNDAFYICTYCIKTRNCFEFQIHNCFKQAGAQWRGSSCCFYINQDAPFVLDLKIVSVTVV